MNCEERLKDYLEGYSSQYDFKDENDIEHDLDSDIEEMLKQNQKLEQALDEIEKYIEEHKHLNWYVESCYKNDLLEIIQKAKGDVKNEYELLRSKEKTYNKRTFTYRQIKCRMEIFIPRNK